MMNPIREKLTADLTSGLNKSLDELLTQGITAKIGSEWTMASLKGRLEVAEFPDGVRQYRLDGIPFLEVHPLELTWEGLKCTASQKYRPMS